MKILLVLILCCLFVGCSMSSSEKNNISAWTDKITDHYDTTVDISIIE